MTDSSATSTGRHTVFDVDVEKLARVYAQAVLDAAGSQEDAVLDELQSVVTEVLDKFPALEHILASELVSQEEKLALMRRLFQTRVATTTLNFLQVLARHGRLNILREVVSAVATLWQQRSNRVPVELELAVAIDRSLQQEVARTLRTAWGLEPIISTRINPDLLAGFVVRVGDKVYDASTRNMLERSRRAMVARAAEAIQTCPAQFMES